MITSPHTGLIWCYLSLIVSQYWLSKPFHHFSEHWTTHGITVLLLVIIGHQSSQHPRVPHPYLLWWGMRNNLSHRCLSALSWTTRLLVTWNWVKLPESFPLLDGCSREGLSSVTVLLCSLGMWVWLCGACLCHLKAVSTRPSPCCMTLSLVNSSLL